MGPVIVPDLLQQLRRLAVARRGARRGFGGSSSSSGSRRRSRRSRRSRRHLLVGHVVDLEFLPFRTDAIVPAVVGLYAKLPGLSREGTEAVERSFPYVGLTRKHRRRGCGCGGGGGGGGTLRQVLILRFRALDVARRAAVGPSPLSRVGPDVP